MLLTKMSSKVWISTLFLLYFLICDVAKAKGDDECCALGGEWTEFYNRDTPDGDCDCETLTELRKENPGEICSKILKIEARLADSGADYTTSGDLVYISKEDGLRCNNDDPQTCSDYEVRFCCAPEPVVCNHEDWTQFFDDDDPGDDCDCEILSDLRSLHPGLICDQPTTMEVKLVDDAEPLSEPEYTHSSLIDGFRCNNAENPLTCRNYKVRFCCPGFNVIPKCPGERWTDFFNIEDPSEEGDIEYLGITRRKFPNKICTQPTSVDARLVDGSYYWTVNRHLKELNPYVGLVCLNEDNSDSCPNYKVRYCCPVVEAPYCPGEKWTPFFNFDSPTTGRGDLETLDQALKYSPEHVCETPYEVDATLANGERFVLGDQSIRLEPFVGLRCRNKKQLCHDYQVRFCCSTEEDWRDAKCPHGEWTEYNSIDTPDGKGDEEYLSIWKDAFPEICDRPTAVDARILNANPDSPDEMQYVHSDPDIGFWCINNDPEGQQCHDYEIRFCCSRVQCISKDVAGPRPNGWCEEECRNRDHCWDAYKEICFRY